MVCPISFFRGGSNTDLKLITCKNNFCILSKIQIFRIALVPYVYPSSKNVQNVGGDSPTFVLAQHQRCRM